MKKQMKTVLIVGIVLLLIVSLYYVFGVSESVFAISSVELTNGKVYWTWFGSANKIDEIYVFNTKPSAFTKPDGSKVIPQDSLTLTISKDESKCVYQTRKETKTYCPLLACPWGIGSSSVNYYILENSERVAKIKIVDGNGVTKIIDGTVVQSVTFYDTDGSGSVTLESQGLLGSKVVCPEYSNVAVYIINGETKFVNKANFESSTVFDSTRISAIEATGFRNAFIGTPTFDGVKVQGNLDIGNVLFTITADQDYFDSTTFTPAEDADPRIDDVAIQSKINEDSSSSIRLFVSNRGSRGTIFVRSVLAGFSIVPSQFNTILDDRDIYTFNIKAGTDIGNKNGLFVVCSTSQFGEAKCDQQSFSIEIVKASEDVEKCGDTICQNFEDFSSCPADCDEDEDKLECAWYQDYFTAIEKDYGAFYWRAIVPFVDPTETKVEGCKTSGWIYFAIAGGFILLLIIAILYIPKRRMGVRKK